MAEPYRADHVGSLLRPPAVLEARAAHAAGRLSLDRLRDIEYTAIIEALEVSVRTAAAAIVAFDVFVHNSDRRRKNPNLFLRDRDLVAFDHAEAFTFVD